MPRYHITTVSDLLVADDEEGIEVADTDALSRMLYASVIEMAATEGPAVAGARIFSAHADDRDGRRVLTATATFTVSGSDPA